MSDSRQSQTTPRSAQASCEVSPADAGTARGSPPPHPLPKRLVSAQPPQPAVSEPPPYVYKPTYYFLYGTLADPATLKGVLGLDSEPVLRNARIYSYELIKWDRYQGLLDSGKPWTVVTGCAYMVQSVEEEYKLACYQTSAYNLTSCAIYFTDGPDGEEDESPTFGSTFRYGGDVQALEQGRFDRASWEAQMGRRLPPSWSRGEDGAKE